MTPRSRTTALRAGVLCIRIARACADKDPATSQRFYRAAWDFFATWGQA